MFFLTQAARPHLKKGAAIINCTSVTMYQGSEELLDYSATKGAITAFTRSLSENLVGDGIRVNAVAPGPIWTPLNPCGGASPGEDQGLRQEHADGPARPAQRGRAGLPVPRLRGFELHVGPGPPPQWRDDRRQLALAAAGARLIRSARKGGGKCENYRQRILGIVVAHRHSGRHRLSLVNQFYPARDHRHLGPPVRSAEAYAARPSGRLLLVYLASSSLPPCSAPGSPECIARTRRSAGYRRWCWR